MPTQLSWILHRGGVGATVTLEGDVQIEVSGEFAGAAVLLEHSHDGQVYSSMTAPIRSPGRQRVIVSRKYLRPYVERGSANTTLVVSMTQQAA